MPYAAVILCKRAAHLESRSVEDLEAKSARMSKSREQSAHGVDDVGERLRSLDSGAASVLPDQGRTFESGVDEEWTSP